MITIKLDNAFSELQCTEEMLKRIRMDCLSYMPEGAEHVTRHNPIWDGRIYLCTKKGIFPSGLYSKLVTFLETEKIPFRATDVRRVEPKVHSFKINYGGFEPRNYQNTCREISREHVRGVYVMGTGAGKTLTSAMLVEEKQVDTLIIVPDTGLREQMSKDYLKWFGDKYVSTNSAIGKMTNVLTALICQRKYLKSQRNMFTELIGTWTLLLMN